MFYLQLALLAVFPAAVIAAALTDATTFLIPNRLSGFLALAFAPAALALGLSPMAFATCLGLGVAGLAVGMVMFALRWIGGGDAKLMAACTVWMGTSAIGPFLFWTAAAGGVLALSLVTLRRSPIPLGAFGPSWFGRLMEPQGDVPYGLAIAAGALIAFPASPLFHALHGL